MARPRKEGLEYFPLDCHMDYKVSCLEAEQGLKGFAIWIKLMQLAYQDPNGEAELREVFQRKTFGKLTGQPWKTIENIILSCCKVGLFDAEIWLKAQIITSGGIKKRIGKVNVTRAGGRERKNKQRQEKLTPTDPSTNPGTNTKVKESKVKESKVKCHNPVTAENHVQIHDIIKGATKPIKLVKMPFGESGSVLLADDEFSKLQAKYNSRLKAGIQLLDDWIINHPGGLSWFSKKYSSAFNYLNPSSCWVWGKVDESRGKAQHRKPFISKAQAAHDMLEQQFREAVKEEYGININEDRTIIDITEEVQ